MRVIILEDALVDDYDEMHIPWRGTEATCALRGVPVWERAYAVTKIKRCVEGAAGTRDADKVTRRRAVCQLMLQFMRHAAKALRCNGFVDGPNSAGSFYVISYYTLL